MPTVVVEKLLPRGSMPRSSSISDLTDRHFLPPLCRGGAPALPGVTVKGETTGSLFGLACLGFLASRFPRFSQRQSRPAVSLHWSAKSVRAISPL